MKPYDWIYPKEKLSKLTSTKVGKLLGCGSFGCAFNTSKGVLKVTSNIDEVNAVSTIKSIMEIDTVVARGFTRILSEPKRIGDVHPRIGEGQFIYFREKVGEPIDETQEITLEKFIIDASDMSWTRIPKSALSHASNASEEMKRHSRSKQAFAKQADTLAKKYCDMVVRAEQELPEISLALQRLVSDYDIYLRCRREQHRTEQHGSACAFRLHDLKRHHALAGHISPALSSENSFQIESD